VDAVPAAASPSPSPWVSIWFSPRRTIRRIVDADAPPPWWPVIALAMVGQIIGSLQFDASGDVNLSRSFMPVAIGLAQTIFSVLVGPFLLAFVGSWFGGEADPTDIRQAVAWSYVPIAFAGLLLIPALLLYGNPMANPNPEVPLSVLILTFMAGIGAFWTLVIEVITFAEVQRFSIVRSIATIAILLIPTLFLGWL